MKGQHTTHVYNPASKIDLKIRRQNSPSKRPTQTPYFLVFTPQHPSYPYPSIPVFSSGSGVLYTSSLPPKTVASFSPRRRRSLCSWSFGSFLLPPTSPLHPSSYSLPSTLQLLSSKHAHIPPPSPSRTSLRSSSHLVSSFLPSSSSSPSSLPSLPSSSFALTFASQPSSLPSLTTEPSPRLSPSSADPPIQPTSRHSLLPSSSLRPLQPSFSSIHLPSRSQ
ncbi:hypothetical protein BDY24DRAFT_71769 [Mrakia frigida]|uniref:uncharacterized protein n=1 Tax=Mrakia frigida TaxID=29902 RepID=UPI003FCC0A0A